MILKENKKIVPKGYKGITLYPFVFINDIKKVSKRFLNHESIHLRQQGEMLILPFYIWYLIEYCIRRLQSNSWKEAYYKISFEKEAYDKDRDYEYLITRKLYSWIKYL